MSIIALSGLKSWHTFAVLIMTAIAPRYAEGPILVIAAIVGFVMGWSWICRRFPRTAWFVYWFVYWFIRGLLKGRAEAALVNALPKPPYIRERPARDAAGEGRTTTAAGP